MAAYDELRANDARRAELSQKSSLSQSEDLELHNLRIESRELHREAFPSNYNNSDSAHDKH